MKYKVTLNKRVYEVRQQHLHPQRLHLQQWQQAKWSSPRCPATS